MLELHFILILAILTYTDVKEKRIPNGLLLLAVVVKILFFLMKNGVDWMGMALIFLDGLIVSLPVWILVILMDQLLKKQTMGGGDIKLLFVTGMYLGWEQNLWMLLVAGVLALLYAIIVRKKELAFGPAIAVATIVLFLRNIIK